MIPVSTLPPVTRFEGVHLEMKALNHRQRIQARSTTCTLLAGQPASKKRALATPVEEDVACPRCRERISSSSHLAIK